MKLQRWIAILLVAVMALSLFTGCKTVNDMEEEAAVGEYIEGEEQEMSGSKPQKGEQSETVTESENEVPEDEEPKDEEPKDDEPKDEEPKDEEPKDEEPKDEEPKDEEPKDEEPKDEEPKDEEPAGDGEEEKPEIKYDPQNHIKVADYNIRCADDGSGKNIEDRAPRLLAYLEKHDPDIIGLQEAVPEWIGYLEGGIGGHESLLYEYEMRYTYRAESSLECTPLLWKKDKFELLDEGYYWLSETPEVESKGWGAKHYRICNWVKLKVKATGKIFIFVNTHLQGGTPASNSAPLIAKRCQQVGGFTQYPVIVTGDFNYGPWEDPYVAWMGVGFKDMNDELGFDESYTNNGYNEKADAAPTNTIKDYIMYAGEEFIAPLTYQVTNENYYNGWIADHRGLIGEFALLD